MGSGMKWILMWALFETFNPGMSAHSTEFNTEEACKHAFQESKKRFGKSMCEVCVPKGKAGE